MEDEACAPGGRGAGRGSLLFGRKCSGGLAGQDGRIVGPPHWQQTWSTEGARRRHQSGGLRARRENPGNGQRGYDHPALGYGRPGPQRKPTPLSAAALASAWKDLADLDAAKACRAMASLREGGPEAVAFLCERVRPEEMPTAKEIDRWLKDLDHARFRVREEARQELEKHLDVRTPPCKRPWLPGHPWRCPGGWTGSSQRQASGSWLPGLCEPSGPSRSWSGSVGGARAVLETLAGGAPAARLTREAKASLTRLSR